MGIVYDVRRKANDKLKGIDGKSRYKNKPSAFKSGSKRKPTKQLTRANKNYLTQLGFRIA